MTYLRMVATAVRRGMALGVLLAWGGLISGCGQDDGLGAQGQTEADLFITQPTPTILTATPSSDPILNIELQFSGISAEADEIIVYRVEAGSGIACQDGESVDILGVNYGNWFDTSVDWGTDYIYCVRTEGDTSRSPFSDEFPVSTPAILPPSTPNISAAVICSGDIIVRWALEPQRQVDTYNITIRDSVTLTDQVFSRNGSTDMLIYCSPPAAPSYDVTVMATNAAGSASTITTITGPPQQPAPPGKPSLLQAGGDARSVQISWVDNSGDPANNDEEAYFNVYRSTDNFVTSTHVGQVDGVAGFGATLNFTDSGLSLGTTYRYVVEAYNPLATTVNNFSVASDPITTPAAPPPPTSHAASVVLIKTTSYIQYDWTYSAADVTNFNVTGFKLYIANPDYRGSCLRPSGAVQIPVSPSSSARSYLVSEQSLGKFVPTGTTVCTYVYANRSDYNLNSARSNIYTLSR